MLLFPIACHNRSNFLFLGLLQMTYPCPTMIWEQGFLSKVTMWATISCRQLFFLSIFLLKKSNLKPLMYPSLGWNSQPACLVFSGTRIRSVCKPQLLSVLFLKGRQQSLFYSKDKPYLLSIFLQLCVFHGRAVPNTYVMRMLTHKNNHRSLWMFIGIK